MRHTSIFIHSKSIAFVITCLFVGSSLFAQNPTTSITNYAIWGSSSAQIGSSSIQGGAIGSNTLVKSVGNMIAGTGANKTNIYSGGTIVLANSNVVNGNMTSGLYPLASQPPLGTIFSAGTSENFTGNIDVYGNIVIGGGTVNGSVKTPTSYKLGNVPQPSAIGTPTLAILPQQLPVITDFSLIYSTPVVIQKITSGTVVPGNYGDLSIGGNSTVTLDGPGTYVFKSITATGPNSSIVFNFNPITTGNFLVYVYGDVILSRTSCSISNGVAGDAKRIFTEVHGTGATNGGVTFSTSNGSNGNGNTSSWFGSVWAPYAAIKIGTPNGPSMAVQGAFWSGTQVNVVDGVNIVYNPSAVNTCTAPSITAQPSASTQTVCLNSSSTPLSVTATGTGLSYQWYSNSTNLISGGTSLGSGSGAQTSTYTPATTIAGTLYYYVVVSGACTPLVTSNVSGAVTINSTSVAGTVSSNQAICNGSSPANITLAGQTGNIQWQSSSDNITFNNIGGATATTLTSIQMGSLNATRYYRAVVTSGVCASVTSGVLTVTVNPTSVAGTVSLNQAICNGSSPANITLTGQTGTIQWQSSPDNITFNNITGATATPLTSAQMGNLATTRYYRAVVTSGVCASATSGVVTVTINALPAIIAQPSVPTATCDGSGTQTISVTATGIGLTYSWRKGGVPVVNGAVVSGQGTPALTLTNPTVADADSYDVVVSGTCTPVVTSNAVTVTVNALPSIVDAAGPDKPYNFDGVTTIGNPGLSGFIFKWTAPPGGLITGADDQATITVLAPGIYKLALKSVAGCTSLYSAEVSNKVNKLIGSELTSIYWNNPKGLPSPFFIMANGYVRIDVIVQVNNYDYVLALLQQTEPTNPVDYGLKNIVTNGLNGADGSKLIITGDFPIVNLLKLNALGQYINYCRPFYAPFSNSGLVNSAGDTTMRSNLVRSGYKINGNGIKVGVISNSYATITNGTTATLPFNPVPGAPQTFTTNTVVQDINAGDLPGDTTILGVHAVNPKGFNTNVHVLQDYPAGTDEGRAMMQIVHDVAPGAELYFRTGFFTAGDFAKGIGELTTAGCKVIVDDVTYITEPYLKDGRVAKTVDSVKALGVTYLSAAGNFASKSYEKDFKPVDASSIGFVGKKAHDFSGTGDVFQHITLPAGDYTIVLQWVDDIYSTGTLSGTKFDMDMYWSPNTDGTGLRGWNRDNRFGDPLEILPFTINSTTDASFLIINNNPGTTGTAVDNPARIKYIIYRGDVQILEWPGGTSTLVGQANAAGAIAVGASRFDKAPPYLAPPLIESFSSIGGTQVEGSIRNKPDVVAPDGVNTTVKMGQDYPNNALDGYSNFFGTSAAAPHAAAVAALIMQGKKKFLDQNPSLSTPDDLKSLLQLTAVDMNTANNLFGTKFDYTSGYGLVDADSAMRTFAAPTATLIDVVVPAAIIPCSGVPFAITITGENFSRNTVVYLINGPGDSTIIIPTFINTGAVSVTINSCIGNPEIKAYTPPKSGTNGKDGGFSNSKYFFSAYVTVEAVSINKKFGETLQPLDTIVKINGVLLQDTTVTLKDIGLDTMRVTTDATSRSDVGTYLINLSRTFDPNNATDAVLMKKYNYKFTDGTVTIAKMPLRVTPDDKAISYGQAIGKVTFKYEFNTANVSNPDSLKNAIKTFHENLFPGNALAVVKDFKKQQIDGTPLDTTNLRNMNMISSFNAVKNSRKFTLLNNTLVPITDPVVLQNNLNVQYLVDVASESIYNYKINPATAKFFSSYPNINAKALLSAASLASDDNNIGTVNVNGSLLKVVSGSLEQMLNSTNGPIVPMVNGLLIQVVDGETVPASSDPVQYVSDGSWVQITNGGTLVKVVNGLLKLVNGTLVKVVSGESSVQLANGSLLKVVSGSLLKVVSGTNTVVYQDGSQVTDSTLIMLSNGLVQITNGSLLKVVSGSLLKVVSGSLLKVVSGSLLKVVSGSLLKVVSGAVLGTDAPNNNTAVILDQEDYGDGTGAFSPGSTFGINMITGLGAGKQFLVPGVLPNPNFDISYGLGIVDIAKTALTVTTTTDSKDYDGTNSSIKEPVVAGLNPTDVIATKPTQAFVDKNAGADKTINASGLVIKDANGNDVGGNYIVSYVPTTGEIKTRAITLTATANSRDYDGTKVAAAIPTITTGTLATGDVAVYSETYNDKNAGTGKTLVPKVISIVDGSSPAASMMANYNVTLSNSINGEIKTRAITITGSVNTKVYDGTTSAAANPTITSGTLASGDVALFSEAYDTKDGGSGKTMTPSVVSILDASNTSMTGNYNVNVIISTNGVVSKVSLTVKADNKTRPFGESNPALTATYSGFVNNETLLSSDVTGNPALTTTATQYSVVSPPTYPIAATAGSLVSTNYVFSFVTGALTITTNQCLIAHDPTNFVSTTTVPTSLWLNLTVKVSGQLVANGDYIIFRAGTINFNNITSNPTVTNLAIPNGKIVADNSVSSAVTSYDAATSTWTTKVPLGFSSTSDIFITGAIINSSNGFVKKNSQSNSVVKGIFYCNKNFSDQWSYAMGAYQSPIQYSDISAPGAVASVNGYYRAGTPTTVLAKITYGGTGNGGNNYTGSSSNQNNFTACIPSTNQSTGNRVITNPSSIQQAVRQDIQDVSAKIGEMQVYPNPAAEMVTLSYVPKQTGSSKIAILTIDGKKVVEIDNGVWEAGKKYVKRIDVGRLTRGVYMIQVTEKDAITNKKIIINR